MELKNILHKVSEVESKIECSLYRNLSNKKMTEEICQKLRKMPVSNGSAYYEKINKNIGLISDEFIYMVYKDCCNLIYLTPQNWNDEIQKLDLVIIVSVWHGLNKEWQSAYKEGSFANEQIKMIKKEARKRDIPVVFYSKEDPPNFEIFLSLAEEVDVIFTSAEECIEKYEKKYPNIPCYHLPFAINPMLHNPIGLCNDMINNTILFAGSWMKKYPVRTLEQKKIFSFIERVGFDLAIIDRNFRRNDRNYLYPLKYIRNIVDSFNYNEIALIYKMFPFVLNLNSVNASNTMFANRVYDASACGSLLLSNESKGMKTLFPEVNVIQEFSDMEKLKLMSEQELQLKRIQTIRNAYRKNTSYDNMKFIFQKVGLVWKDTSLPSVCVVLSKECQNENKYYSYFEKQTYENKVCISNKNMLEDIENYDYITFWSSEQYYDEYYLEDMLNGFKFTNSDFISRNENGYPMHSYINQVICKYRTVFKVDRVNDKILKNEIEEWKGNGYSIHN